MPTTDQLLHWFTFAGPGDDATKVKHKAIRQAEATCDVAIAEAMIAEDFPRISDACLTFASVINDLAPESADKTAAIRCVRIARMAANESIMLARRQEPEAAETCAGLAMQELRFARYQCSAAIALGGK